MEAIEKSMEKQKSVRIIYCSVALHALRVSMVNLLFRVSKMAEALQMFS
jgi:hypothetical protein